MANCRYTIPTFNALGCEIETGRIVAIAFVDEDKADAASAANWSSASFWNTETYVTDILIHSKTNGTYTAAPVTVPGKGTQGTRLAGMDHTATVRLEGVANSAYFNALNKSENYRAVLVFDDYSKIMVADENCNIFARLDVQDDVNSVVDWVIDITWKSINNPTVYTAPSGIFV
jgi:hypothetical protein